MRFWQELNFLFVGLTLHITPLGVLWAACEQAEWIGLLLWNQAVHHQKIRREKQIKLTSLIEENLDLGIRQTWFLVLDFSIFAI